MKSNAILVCCSIFFYVSLYAQVLIDFEDVHLTNSYQNGFFYDSNSVLWQFTKARSGSTAVNANRALCLHKDADAILISDTIVFGISHLSFQYQQAFSTNCNALVYINDSLIATLKTQQNQNTCFFFETPPDFIYAEPCVIKIKQASSSSGQISIDDIRYTQAYIPPKPLVVSMHSLKNDSLFVEFSDTVSSCELLINGVGAKVKAVNPITIYALLPKNWCGNGTVTIQNTLANSGMILKDTSFTIVHTKSPRNTDIIITELMVQTSNNFGAYPFEYIELYNRSECPIHMKNTNIIINNNSTAIPDFIIYPHTHVVICKNAGLKTTEFVIVVPSLPSLPNTQGHVALNYSGHTLASVFYHNSWYKNNFKTSGGWSLEKIDYNNFSESSYNWKASENITGGSPGFYNSVYNYMPENEPLSVISMHVEKDFTCKIIVSKNICISSLKELKISNNTILDIRPHNNTMHEYIVQVNKKFEAGIVYELYHNNCVDLQGNAHELTYSFALYDTLQSTHKLVIHEILSNPNIGDSEFIELYNASDYYYNLHDIYLARMLHGEYTQIHRAAEHPTMLPPKGFAVISKNAEQWKELSPCKTEAVFSNVKSLPTLPQSEGIVVVLNQFGEAIDIVHYNASMHKPTLETTRGVSLERVSVWGDSNAQTNWKSTFYNGKNVSPGCNGNNHKAIHIIIKNNHLHAYTNKTYIEFSCSSSLSQVEIHIYNMQGILVYKKNIPTKNSTFINVEIERSDLFNKKILPGIYILKARAKTEHSVEETKEMLLYIE